MIIATWADANELFYEKHDCLSDDSDMEEARVEKWVESEGHIILEDNPDAIQEEDPQKEVDRENARAIGIML